MKLLYLDIFGCCLLTILTLLSDNLFQVLHQGDKWDV